MKNFDDRMESIRNKSQLLRSKNRRRSVIALSCTGVFVVALLLTLFVPYSSALPSVAKYKDSPYYHVIEKLNAYTYCPPTYKNNFQTLIAGAAKFLNAANGSFLAGGMDMAPSAEMAPTDNVLSNIEGSTVSESYVEVTDNQVEGVIEADVFKRSDRYIYHLYNEQLNIYTIAAENSEKIAAYAVQDLLPENMKLMWGPDMYLSADCRTLTLVLPVRYFVTMDMACLLLNLDISDPERVKPTNHILFYGTNFQTRMTDGQFLLIYQAQCGNAVDFDKPETFVPTYGTVEETLCISGEDIVVPESIGNKNYTVVCKLNAATLELLDSKALMSYSSDIYVSQENIYTWYPYWQIIDEAADRSTKRQLTDITCVSYAGDDIQVENTFTVEGVINDQYSLDEYDGILRAVSSTVADKIEDVSGGVQADIWMEPANKSVNLYCFDLDTGEVAGKVEGFAPQGEEATSVRFEGTTAYVCTAQITTLSDPVFFFDLSDPKNITWTDTGTIDGYSTSLVNFGEGTLLGIGYDENRSLKVELYRKEDGKVVGISDYTLDCDFSENYKDYYIDRENGYIGLAVYAYKTDEFQYLLLHFDGEMLVVEKQLPIKAYGVVEIRADVIEDWLYILASDLTVVKP